MTLWFVWFFSILRCQLRKPVSVRAESHPRHTLPYYPRSPLGNAVSVGSKRGRSHMDQHCPHCGAIHSMMRDAFCTECGEALDEPARPIVAVRSEKKVEPPSPSFVVVERSKRRSGRVASFLFGFYAVACLYGIRDIYPKEHSILDFLLPIAAAFVLGLWAVADSQSSEHPIPLLSRSWLFLFAPPAVAFYLIWSRGWRGVGLLLLHFFGFCFVFAVSNELASTFLFGVRRMMR